MFPAASTTLSAEVTVPLTNDDMSTTPAEAATAIVWPRESVNVTVAVTTSGSMPETENATAVRSTALIAVSGIDRTRLPSASAVRSMLTLSLPEPPRFRAASV